MAIEFGKELISRANTRAEIGAKHLTDQEIQKLNDNRRGLMEYLGYDIGENWENGVPMVGMTPRMYVMQTDDNGVERAMVLSSANIKPGSADFWRQVQLGNIFAFPAGATEPVQMQINTADDKAEIQFSKPVTKENLPDPPAKPLGFWKTIASWFGGYKKEKAAWNKRRQNKDNAITKLEDMKADRAKSVGEGGQLEKSQTEALLKDYDARQDLKASEKHAASSRTGMDLMTSIYQPQPKMSTKKGVLQTDTRFNTGLYTKENFDSLKVYPKDGPDGIDLDKITVGKESVKPEEFAAVTMYALWQPEIARKGLDLQKGFEGKNSKIKYDPYAEESILNYENPLKPEEKLFKPEDVNPLLTASVRNWWTGDLFMDPPRQNEGEYFKEVTNAGRKLTVDAFKAYAAGDKSKLAKLIADGINMVPGEMAKEEGSLNPQQQAAIVTSGKLLELMNRDPELKAEAFKQGMKADNLIYNEGLKNFNRLYEEGKEAERKLAEARVNGTEIPQQEKINLTKAMLKPKIALTQLGTENSAQNETPERETIMTDIFMKGANYRMPNGQKADKLTYEQWSLHPEKRPKPAPGQIHMDTAMDIYKNVNVIWNKKADSVIKLAGPEGEKNLDKLAGNIIKAEGLENKSVDWLYKEFQHNAKNPTINVADSIIKVAKNTYNIGQEEPKPELQGNQPKVSIQDRKAMFEQPKKGLQV